MPGPNLAQAGLGVISDDFLLGNPPFRGFNAAAPGGDRRQKMSAAGNHPSRRGLLQGAGLALGAGALAQIAAPPAAQAAPEPIWSAEY